jgi:hypothetical protein
MSTAVAISLPIINDNPLSVYRKGQMLKYPFTINLSRTHANWTFQNNA